MQAADLVAGLVIFVGLVGIVLPLLPGMLLIAVAILGWAAYVGGGFAWSVAAVALLLLGAGAVVKYALAGRHLRSRGVPNRTLVVGGLAGIAGFFVVPLIGLPLGFVLGIYASELQRLGRDRAWPATMHALTAVGIALFVELVAGFAAAGTWLLGALNT